MHCGTKQAFFRTLTDSAVNKDNLLGGQILIIFAQKSGKIINLVAALIIQFLTRLCPKSRPDFFHSHFQKVKEALTNARTVVTVICSHVVTLVCSKTHYC